MRQECPNCDSVNTKYVWREFHQDHAIEVRLCNECPTEWDVEFGRPTVTDVRQYED